MKKLFAGIFSGFLLLKSYAQDLPHKRNSFGFEIQIGSNYSFSNYSGLTNNLGTFSNNPRPYFGIGVKSCFEIKAKTQYILSGALIKSRGNLIENPVFLKGSLIQRSINISIPVEYIFRHYNFYFGLGLYYDRMVWYTSKVNDEKIDIPFLKNGFSNNQLGGILSLGYWKDLNNGNKLIVGLKNQIPSDLQLPSVTISINYFI